MSPQVSLSFQQGSWKHIPITYRENHIIIKLNVPDQTPDTDIENIFEDILSRYFEMHKNVAIIGKWGYFQVFAASGDPQVPLRAEQITAHEADVEYAEPDLAMQAAAKPNDPMIDGVNMDNPNFALHQWPVDYLEMPAAWDDETGKDHVLIAVLDSGVPLVPADEYDIEPGADLEGWMNHEDLEGKRFIAGRNYLADPYDTNLNDSTGHGTKMVGTIAAKENNRDETTGEYLGIAGMNWGSYLYICRILDDKNETTTGLFYQAVEEVLEYAAAREKKVVFHSTVLFTDPELTDMDVGTFNDQCGKLAGYGAVMVFAVGNDSSETNKRIVRFPAAAATYKPHILVAVGAVTTDGTVWSKSNIGGMFTLKDGDELPVAVTVVAPGDDVATTNNDGGYYSESGTCTAGAHVAGLLSLMWSLNKKMTGEQIIQCLKRTSRIPAVAGGEDIECTGEFSAQDNSYGYGVIRPTAALACVDWEVTLDTPSVSFVNVTEGDEPSLAIELSVKSCADITFTVRCSGDDFGIAEGTYTHKPEDGPVFRQLVATYSSGLPDEASAVIAISWDQDPDATAFEVHISANRVAARNSVIFLAVDKSGSMKTASGIGSYSRMDVLKYSSGILVDLIEEGSGMGVIAFDETAHQVEGLRVIEPGDPDPARSALKTGIDGLGANGWTSIAAGIQRASEDIDSIAPELVSGDETKAIIVLTDGKENRAPFLADIMTEELPYPVYAIGMGSPDSLETDQLLAVTNMTGGYTVITGELDDTSEYAIAGFFYKILAEINGEGIALDPGSLIKPGHTQEFPIKVTKADKRLDIVLMKPEGAEFDVQILAPGKDKIEFSSGKKMKANFPGVSTVQGSRVSRCRIPLPLEFPGGHASHAGTWRVSLSMKEAPFKSFLGMLDKNGLNTSLPKLHGVRYALQAAVKSNLKFRVRLIQDGLEPGSNILVRAVVTQNNLPLHDPTAQIKALLNYPDGIEDVQKLSLKMPGVYEAGFQATIPGVYSIKIVAAGRTTNGDKYQREQVLTGIVRSL